MRLRNRLSPPLPRRKITEKEKINRRRRGN